MMTPAPRDPAFAEALLAQTSWLRGLVRTLIGDTARVDDVCQATLLEAWRYRPKLEGSLRPWLARVARRVTGHLSMRERQRPAREARAARRDDAPSAAEVVEQVAWHETVVNAVMALDEPYRSTILLRFWEDAPPREVARRMAVPVETVRTRLKRGLAMLRERLDRECGGRRAWFAAVIPLARYEGTLSLTTTTMVNLMSKKLASIAFVLVAGLAMTYALWPDPANRSPDATPPEPSTADATPGTPPVEPAREAVAVERAAIEPDPRTATGPLDDDPAIAAALCGFRGRTVGSSGEPIANCTVRIYRHSFDRLAAPGVDLLRAKGRGPGLAESAASTDRDGEFLISGVWPHGLYFLVADGGTHGRMLRIVDRAPDPGQVVDLGDVRLDADGVVTGTVVDAADRPVAGALVRAVDLPGAVFAAAPLEWFDPDGAILLRERLVPVAPVIEVPPWARDLYEKLPIAAARTGADGRFRLTGVTVGDNAVLITHPELQPTVETRVVVERGQDRDLGRVRMRRGAEVSGRVVDPRGRAVAGAEVLVAPASALAPVDLARRVADTDDDGRFLGLGFPPGQVTIAVRRGEEHAWTVLAPRPATRDIVVTLVELCDLEIEATSATGRPIETLALEVFPGPLTRQAVGFRMLGLQDPLALDGRVRRESGSRWTVQNLEPGSYVVAASCRGHARSLRAVELPRDDRLVIELDLEAVHEVLVTNAMGSPIRNAEVFVEPEGSRKMAAVPLPRNGGRTGADGRLELRHEPYDRVLVTALHPAHGAAAVVARADQRDVHITMQQPGAIDGRVVEHGAAPPPGRYSVTLRRRDGTGRSVVEESPSFASVGADGGFAFGSLQPGWYEVSAIGATSTASSLGDLVETFGRWDRSPDRTVAVEVRAGEPTEARISIGTEPVGAEATARLTGSVFLDGKPGNGVLVRLRGFDGTDVAEARADAAGAFDTGPIPSGGYRMSIYPGGLDDEHTLYVRMLELAENEIEHVDVSISTASIGGEVVRVDGRPVAGADVDIIRASRDGPGILHFRARSDARGRFRMKLLPAGPYQIRAMHDDPPTFAEMQTLEVVPGLRRMDLRLSMLASFAIRGSIDRARQRLNDAGHLTLRLRRQDAIAESVLMIMVARTELTADDTFEFLGIGAGTYSIEVETDSGRFLTHRVPIEVTDRAVEVELDLVENR